MKTIKSMLAIAITAGIAFTSCSTNEEQPTTVEQTANYSKKNLKFNFNTNIVAKGANTQLSVFQEINKDLKGYGIAQVEIYNVASTPDDKNKLTVIPVVDASDEYRTGFRFIPNDARRDNRDNLTYVTVSDFATSANGIASEQIFDDMYRVWQNETNCNNVSIDKQNFSLATDGLPSSILSFGDAPQGPIADHNVLGYIPPFLFDALDLGANTLAVNFSFGFRDEDGNFTDINGDGKIDLSHTETWFNDGVNWSTDGAEPGSVDVATVALHEFGHSLGLGHSGVLLASFDGNGDFTGELNFTPVNVMNPSYIGNPKRDLAGDDNSIFCENFSAWPYY